jgi:DNA-binding transcriptional ArsR family regulator
VQPRRRAAYGAGVTTELLSALGDQKRLAVLGALCAAPHASTVADLRERTGLSERDVQRALAVLGGAGLVRRDDAGLSADLEPIRTAAADAVAATPVGRVAAGFPRLDGCLKNGRIATIPADDGLKADLGRLVMAALPPRDAYTERELTTELAVLGDDAVALRRLLVDFGYVGRDPDGSRYWPA